MFRAKLNQGGNPLKHKDFPKPIKKGPRKPLRLGPLAQMGERLVRNEEVAGSIPVRSTIIGA